MQNIDWLQHLESYGLIPINLILNEDNFNYLQDMRDNSTNTRFAMGTDWNNFNKVKTDIKKYINLDNKVICYSLGFMPYAIFNKENGSIVEIPSGYPDDMWNELLKSLKNSFKHQNFMKIEDITNKTSFNNKELNDLKDDIETIIMLTETRLKEFILETWYTILDTNKENFTSSQYKALIRHLYIFTRKYLEYPSEKFNTKFIKVLSKYQFNNVFENDNIENYLQPNKQMTLYRGVTANRSLFTRNPLSWTDSFNTAKFFANRFNKNSKNNGKVYKLIINTDNVLCYYNDDSEPEYILNPKYVKKMYKNNNINNI